MQVLSSVLCSAASYNMEPQFTILAWIFLVEILSSYSLTKLNQSPQNGKFWNEHYMWKTQTSYIHPLNHNKLVSNNLYSSPLVRSFCRKNLIYKLHLFYQLISKALAVQLFLLVTVCKTYSEWDNLHRLLKVYNGFCVLYFRRNFPNIACGTNSLVVK